MKHLLRCGVIISVLGLILGGCSFGLTPAQRTLWALDVYENQYNMYLDAVINPSLTPEQIAALKISPELILQEHINPQLTESQRDILRVKKQILIELKPLVLMAAQYHQTGQLPPEEVQKKMTELINKLVAMAEE